jgi:hypothetical protein
MHALTAKVKKVCNLTKCLALLTHLKDFGIAGLIGCRSWFQWPPFPSANHFESSDTFGGQDPLLVALADVANPRTDKDFVSVDNFNQVYESWCQIIGSSFKDQEHLGRMGS